MLSFFKFFRIFPLWLAHGVGMVLGWLVFLASKSYRRKILANTKQAGFSFLRIHSCVTHAGRMVCELPRLWFGKPVPILWENVQLTDQAYESAQNGSGIIFLTPHLGCFEITAQALAQRYSPQYGEITVLFRPHRKNYINKVLLSARTRPGLATAPTNTSGIKQMLKALKTGKAIGLLPDQVPPLGLGVWAPFFNRPAYTMTLAARLAHQSKAQIILIWGERLAWGRGFRIHTQAMPSLDLDTVQSATQINQAMQNLITHCPQQYLWAYERYKQPRQQG